MDDHTSIASLAMQLKKRLEEYIEEYDPWNGDQAHALTCELIMEIDAFTKLDETA